MNCSLTFGDFMKSAGPLISALVAIFLFYLATNRDKKKERARKKHDYEARVEYITELANTANNACKLEKQNLIDYSNRIKKEPLRLHQFMIGEVTTIDRLFKVIGEEFSFNAITRLKIKEHQTSSVTFFTELTIPVDYLYGIHHNIMDTIQESNKSFKEDQRSYADFQSKLMNALRTFAMNLDRQKPSPIEVKFIAGYLKIQQKFGNESSRDIGTHYNKFIKPLLELCDECSLKEFSDLAAFMKIIELASSLHRLYDQIKDSCINHSQFIDYCCVEMESAMNTLSKHVNHLKQKLKIDS